MPIVSSVGLTPSQVATLQSIVNSSPAATAAYLGGSSGGSSSAPVVATPVSSQLITYQGKTFDLATSAGMTSYKAAINIPVSTPQVPTTDVGSASPIGYYWGFPIYAGPADFTAAQMAKVDADRAKNILYTAPAGTYAPTTTPTTPTPTATTTPTPTTPATPATPTPTPTTTTPSTETQYKLYKDIPNARTSTSVMGRNYIQDTGGNWYYDMGAAGAIKLPAGTIPYALSPTANQWLPPKPEDFTISQDGKYATTESPIGIYDHGKEGAQRYDYGTQGIQNTLIRGNTPLTTPSTTTTPGQTPDQQKQILEDYLAQSGLDDGQKAIVRAIYSQAISMDSENTNKIIAAMEAAKEYNDPYFKAQISLAVDALQRSISSQEANLGEQEASLQRTLTNLQQDVEAGKDYLSFQQTQELRSLERQYSTKLEDTQNTLAATGFTQSSRRVKEEQLLGGIYGDIRESTTRSFTERESQLTQQLERGQTNTAAEIERLRRLTEEGKIADLRQAEEYLGSGQLGTLGYQGLGGIGGTLPRQEVQSQLDFASQFVF